MSEGNSTESLVFSRKSAFKVKRFPALYFYGCHKASVSATVGTHRRQAKSGHLHFSELHCAVNHFSIYFSLMLRCFLSLCKYSIWILLFLSLLSFLSDLLKYFWCFWNGDVPPRCCTLSGATILVLLPHPLGMLCFSAEVSRHLQGPEEQTSISSMWEHCPSISESSDW